jgi:DNA transposition AAA+ family ATPase
LKIAEYRVHHGGDHLCDVLQGKHHQTVRFFVVSQVGHSHVFADQQLVKVAAEIVDDIEQELVGGKK